MARAAPDGYTLLLANPSLAISPLIYPKLNYRPLEDLVAVGQYGTVPNVLVVNPALPVQNIREFIAYVRKNPGKLNYGSPGYGTSPQMSSELFKAMSDTFIVHIPFRGSGPAQAALLGNEIQLMIDNLPPQPSSAPEGARARGHQPDPVAGAAGRADVRRGGAEGRRGDVVVGLSAPAGTPRPVVMRLNEALNRTTQDPQVRDSSSGAARRDPGHAGAVPGHHKGGKRRAGR